MIKNYLNVKGSDTKKVKVAVFYSKGGINYFNYKQEKRGYYVSVRVVDREVRNGYITESFSMFDSGYKQILKEVGRASKKAEQFAESIAMEYAKPIIERVCQEQGIELE